jgi:hypothetical protein
MSLGIGPHDADCQCLRCVSRRLDAEQREREIRQEKIRDKHYELTGVVQAFLESKSMKALAATDMDFEWWFRCLAKKVAEIDAAV